MVSKIYNKSYYKISKGSLCGRSEEITRDMKKYLRKRKRKTIRVHSGKVAIYVRYAAKQGHKVGEFVSSTLGGPKLHDLKRRAEKKKEKKRLNQLKRQAEKNK